jgi:hypothetical protein
MRGILLAIVVAGSAGCLRTTEFKCQANGDCSSSDGVCESTGYCSFTDSMCTGGRRYGDFSGSYSGKCIGDSTLPDGGMPDGKMPDVPAGQCPATYAALAGAGSHVYRVIAATGQWIAQRDACAADSGGYLAIPDDMAELQALLTASAQAKTWVGIDDITTEGTYVTVNNTTPGFLPWNTAAGEPDNPGGSGGEDCVAALMSNQKIETDKCNLSYPAVCECEP